LEGYDQEDHSSKSTWAKRLRDPPSQSKLEQDDVYLLSQSTKEAESRRVTVSKANLGKKHYITPSQCKKEGLQ
jgi:hypothetical protein